MSDDIVYDLEGMDWDDIRERPSKAAALMEDAAAEITRLRARVAELKKVLLSAKQDFIANEPQKAFIEICAALEGKNDG